MIGGKDITISTASGTMAMEIALKEAVQLWPTAIIEDAETGEAIDSRNLNAISVHSEVLIYKDQLAANRWRDIEADDSLLGTLIHLLTRANQLTIVLDAEPSEEFNGFLRPVRNQLRETTILS